MAGLDLSTLPNNQRATGLWVSALLHALARDEAAGRRPERLTEPQLGTWSRFRGRLTATDLMELLFEDAAVLHRIPFDPALVGAPGRVDQVPPVVSEAWLAQLKNLDLMSAGAEYIAEQARLLGLPGRFARSELHAVKPHHKVLELPGTGGQLAYHLASNHAELSLQANFTIGCSSWQELTLAGIIGLELGAPHTDFAVRVELDDLRSASHPLRQRSFDFVIGLHPDKGGLFRVEDQLAIWFPNAKTLLV